MSNPYRWQYDRPEHVVSRAHLVGTIATHLRDGKAVKLIGGRGMGKSVLLRQLSECFESDTRVVLVPGPPAEATMPALVHDLAARLQIEPLPRPSMDLVMEALDKEGVNRLIVLLDEIDQYVLADGHGNLARLWLNYLETMRKQWTDRFSVAVAGGLGLLHVSHVLGSGLVSRAESCIARPFDLDELRELAAPLAQSGVTVDEPALLTLAALSGGNPALATYGLAAIWEAGNATIALLQGTFAGFLSRHRDFVRAVEDGVSHRGLVGAPGRVLALVRQRAGSLSQAELRAACAGDEPPVDVPQALQLLEAAGLVLVHGLTIDDPVQASPVVSVLNLPSLGATKLTDPVEMLLDAIAAILAAMHRFGRDFHGKGGLLEEQVFSSILAVGLEVLGWQDVHREPVQAAGYTDLRARLSRTGVDGHIVVESKIWPRDCQHIQQQIDDYRLSNTLHGVAVVIGDRKIPGWVKDYEQKCLGGLAFERMPKPADVVARWRVDQSDATGHLTRTDHFLVEIPKRAKPKSR